MADIHQGQRWDYIGPSGRRAYAIESVVNHAQFVGAQLRNLETGKMAWATRRWLNEDKKPRPGHWELVG